MRRVLRIIALILVALLVIAGAVIGFLWFAPMGSLPLIQANPVSSYDEAMARIADVQARDSDDINELCQTFALTHDERREHAIALLHGMSNCPQQWLPFATLLFEAGYNVYVPRMPYNGYQDRLDVRASNIRPQDLVQYGSETVDILQGLGEEIAVMGISAGGSVTTWMAMNRDDIDESFIIAPSFLGQAFPAWLARPSVNFMRYVPNQRFWWDTDLKEDIAGPPYAAPLIYSREAGEQFRFGQMLLDQAREVTPGMPVTFVRNENDGSINIDLVGTMIDRWTDGGAALEILTIPGGLGVDHDIIDIYQTSQRIDIIYPQLFEIVTGEVFAGELPQVP